MPDPYSRIKSILGSVFAKESDVKSNESTRLDEKGAEDEKDVPEDTPVDDAPADDAPAGEKDSQGNAAEEPSGNAAGSTPGGGDNAAPEDDIGGKGGGSGGSGGDSAGANQISVERPSSGESPSDSEPPKDSEPEDAGSKQATPPKPAQSDQQKIESMFVDTGDMDIDYSLSNDSNTRLARFKFTNAGIDVSLLLSDIEKSAGVRADELENRLSPAQRALYRNKSIELRKKHPEIDAREKNIIIYNSNVPFVKKDFSGKEVAISDEQVQEAYKKINKYMMKKYGRYWQDRHEAVDFITSIRVNFSEKESIRPNLSYVSDVFPEQDSTVMRTIYFDEINIKIPKFVEELLKNNTDNEKFKKSSVFRSLVSSYLPGPTKANSVYAIIKPEEVAVEAPADAEEANPEDADPADAEADAGAAPTDPADDGVEELQVDDSDVTDQDIEDAEIEL